MFPLVLHETYYHRGFFNVKVAFDDRVRSTDGPIQIFLGDNSKPINGVVNRQANMNGTARIFGGTELRDWFQTNSIVKGTVQVEFLSPNAIRIRR